MRDKIVVIGPNSVHTKNFIDLVKDEFKEIVVLGSDGAVESPHVTKQASFNFRASNPIKQIQERKRFKAFIMAEKPSVVHIQQVTRHAFFTLGVLKKIGVPTVLTAWGSDVLVMPQKNLLFKRLVQKALKRADVVTADSKDLIDAIGKLGRKEQTELVLLGITPIKPGDKGKVIYSNRLHNPLYNIDEVIRLFYEFQKEHTDWRLRIGAIGNETENLKVLVKEKDIEDKVDFIGWLDPEKNVQEYQEASIYISIPSSDGTAVSLLEAMSAGCIPVVADLKVSHEWIKDGHNGVIYDAAKENPLTRALSINQAAAAQHNQAIINEKGTKGVATGKFVSIYSSLIDLK